MAGTAIIRIGDREWQVSVAATPAELASGLGGIESLLPWTGMLFDLGYERPLQVTTEPMLFPLDIVFIGEDLKVIDVVQDVEPGNIVSEQTPARYFLEMNAGEAEGIEPGDGVIVEYDEIPATGWLDGLAGVLGLLAVTTLVVGIASPAFNLKGVPNNE